MVGAGLEQEHGGVEGLQWRGIYTGPVLASFGKHRSVADRKAMALLLIILKTIVQNGL